MSGEENAMLRRRSRTRQRGVTFVFLTLSIVALCGVAALAIDEGLIWNARNRAQLVADSAALAAAKDLTSSSDSGEVQAAKTGVQTDVNNVVNAYATNGNIAIVGTPTVTYPTSYKPDCGDNTTTCNSTAVNASGAQVATVQVTVRAPAAFGAVVGQNGVNVKAKATVMMAALGGYGTTVPWGPIADQSNPNTGDSSLDADLIWLYDIANGITPSNGIPPKPGIYQTKSITLKATTMSGSTVQSAGNFGEIDLLNSSGGNDYRTNIGYNSSQSIQIGDTLSLLTGNKQGPTSQGISDRLSTSTPNGLDHYFSTYDDWFYGRSTYPAIGTDGTTGHTIYADPYRQDPRDARVIVVPLISSPGKNGSANVTVLGFAVFFMEATVNGNGKGVVTGRFIGMTLDGTASSSSSAPTTAVTSQLIN